MVARTAGSREAEIAREAAARWRAREPEREEKLAAIRNKEYTKADTLPRLAARVRRIGEWVQAAADTRGLTDEAREESAAATAVALKPEDITDELVERTIGRTRELLSIEFFEQGLDAARCVGRVTTMGEANGTGFLVAPGIMLTNHHVLPRPDVAAASELELDFEENRVGPAKSLRSFRLLPDRFFCADKALDFAFVAVAEEGSGDASLAEYGFRALIGAEGKATIGECVNIIQHPEGEPKQIVIRNNQLVDLPDDERMKAFFHYLADTERGSSGSPVFNDQWEVVALHHSGVPKTNERGELVDAAGRVLRKSDDPSRLVWVANEGVRISHIVKALRAAPLPGRAQELVRDQVLAVWDGQEAPAVQENAVTVRIDSSRKQRQAEAAARDVEPQSTRAPASTPPKRPRDDLHVPAGANGHHRPSMRPRPRPDDEHDDGSVSLTIPLRISISFDHLAAGARSRVSVEAAAGEDDLLVRV